MRPVFQHHIKTMSDLRAHWGAWHNGCSENKKKRIALFEKNFQAGKWKELLDHREGEGLMPYEYVRQGFFN